MSERSLLRLAMVLGLLVLPVQGAVVSLSKTTACPGEPVQITGDGWLEPPPSCHYRFLFDAQIGTFAEVAARQPDGLYGPPSSSFVIPADAQLGPHTVKVQLYLDSGEFMQEATQNLSVAGMRFEGVTDCKKLDGGFDATENTGDVPWASTVVGRTVRHAKAKAVPAGAAQDFRFRSDAAGVMTVNPPKASGPETSLRIRGVSAGTAQVEAYVEAEGGETVCSELNVAVYAKKTVKVAMHVVQMKGCAKPIVKLTAGAMRNALNKMWDQAGVQFTVTLNKFVNAKAIDADTDADCKGDEVAGDPPSGAVTFGPELMTIHDAAKSDTADVNVYWLQDYQYPFGAYHTAPKAIFVMGLEDQGGGTTLASDLLLAHELGHHLDLDHCDSDRNCNGLGDTDLMHSANEGCILFKSQWDDSNTAAGR